MYVVTYEIKNQTLWLSDLCDENKLYSYYAFLKAQHFHSNPSYLMI